MQFNSNRKQSAFTLIELLVVIAIIAILAAILFPVLSQARNAAKKASSISNLKQSALAINMYNTDSDDVYPMSAYPSAGGTFDATAGVQVLSAGATAFSTYDAIQPYMKNLDILKSPGDPEAVKWNQIIPALGFVQPLPRITTLGYGINFAVFEDPSVGPNLGSADPVVSASSIDESVNTVLFYDAQYVRGASGFAGPTGPKIPTGEVTGFYTRWIAKWTAAGGTASSLTPYTNPSAGGAQGVFGRYNFPGIARYQNTITISFADGHTKAINGNGRIDGATGDDLNTTTAETTLPAYVLPYDLNGIPGLVAEPRS